MAASLENGKYSGKSAHIAERKALDLGTYWELATVQAGCLRSEKQRLVLLAYASNNWGEGNGGFGSPNQEAYTECRPFSVRYLCQASSIKSPKFVAKGVGDICPVMWCKALAVELAVEVAYLPAQN